MGALVLALGIGACGPVATSSPSASIEAEVTVVVDEPGDYFGVAWVDESVIFGNDALGDASKLVPWRVSADGGDPEPIPLDLDPACVNEEFGGPIRSPSGILVLSHTCQLQGSDESGPGALLFEMVETTPEGQQPRKLADLIRLPRAVSLRGEDDGVYSAGSFICQGLIAFSPTGNRPLEVTVAGESGSFSLADEFDSDEDCAGTGIADFPAFHPTDDEMYFFASPDAVGVSGDARLDQPWAIYRTSGLGNAERLLTGVMDPRGLAWSFDGEWLAFSGDIDGVEGLWAFRPATKARILISGDLADWLTWSPDGYLLAVISKDGDDVEPPQRQIRVLDATRLAAMGD